MDREINTERIPLTDWDPNKAPAKVEALIKKVQSRATWYMKWYKDEKKIKRRGSKSIRALCITIFILTSLIPLVQPLLQNLCTKTDTTWVLNIGYITAVIGAGLLFMDRFYGFSTGWMRLNSTLTELGNARRDFENILMNERLTHSANTVEGFQALVSVIKTFDDNISAIVKAETDQWIKEFQAGNVELQNLLKTQSDQQKPGNLSVSVKDYLLYEKIQLFINGSTKSDIVGGTCLIPMLPPGTHSVKITAKRKEGNIDVVKTDVAIVKPGETTTIEIAFA